ncbi:MAG TPA: polysaccharide deacetylase family protein [Bryobacteraceae bacterium]|nr:polysaccharide deacetylase family protein [Bryobacteraceae bacterium]HOQ44637.1 polysaccharide deacetylase family protein [Bryobacteraceae bacterium]HPQ15944.1 polysaccharide deacetylase family protein [Bryobacteraceae bacterium]HPU71847.1 polysaccharide deacetylase family protein [Bryobacteraceae bacterium]
MLLELVGGAACGLAGLMTYGVRGRSSTLFAPSVWRGANRKAIALTFDDGPSESTPLLLELLAREGVPATFFQCGVNVRRLPGIAREVARAGHEIGNHSDSHPRFYLRSPAFMEEEMARAQAAIEDAAGVRPALFRVPYGARWFGLRRAQQRLGLMGVMWTAIGRDWKLKAGAITSRLLGAAANGAIFCLHDGRELEPRPDIRETLEAVRRLIPELRARGYHFETVSQILCPMN